MRGFLADDKQALQGCNCFISIYNTIFLIKSKEFLARLKSQIKLFKSRILQNPFPLLCLPSYARLS